MLKRIFKNREVINYIIVGILTTVISLATYFLFTKLFNIDYITSTILSWIISVAFAYVASKLYVFKSSNSNLIKEIIDFVQYRLLSLLIEVAIMVILIDIMNMDDGVAKLIVQVVVLILNYVFSKLFVFKK